MIKQLGRWLRITPDTVKTSPSEDLGEENGDAKEKTAVIKDADLEFLFYQLLEGVANGWQESSIEQFFQKLQPRITLEIWLDWLQRYRRQLINSSGFHTQLAARMIRLGEVSAKLPFVRSVGDLAYEIGKELLHRSKNNPLVESLSPVTEPLTTVSDKKGEKQKTSSPVINQGTSLGDFLSLLQKDENFAAEIAQQLGLDSVEPGTIIAKIVQGGESDSLPMFSQATSQELVNYLFESALEKAQNGELEEAVSLWSQVVSLDPNFHPAWHNRGSALAYLNRLPEAIECFDRAIALNVNDHLSWNNRGNALFRLRRWQEAIISWERVIGIRPNSYDVWYRRGLALENIDDMASALKSYKQCLNIKPDFAPAQERYTKISNYLSHLS